MGKVKDVGTLGQDDIFILEYLQDEQDEEMAPKDIKLSWPHYTHTLHSKKKTVKFTKKFCDHRIVWCRRLKK